MELGLRGRQALVTGSSRGIGRATAEALLREGASVCLCARGADGLERSREELSSLGKVTAIAADVSKPEDARRVVEHAIAQLGGLRILVNNVGGSGGAGAFDQATETQWRQVLELNLFATVWSSGPAVEWMKHNGGGAIVNIGSIFGREYATSAPYTAAKAALTALTKEMAVDLARYGIRVNSVAPGSILFPGGSWDRRQRDNPGLVKKLVDEQLPFKRFGRPEEVASAVVFLCSEKASWITGASLPVDGAQGRAF